jgi:hypothetical protein
MQSSLVLYVAAIHIGSFTKKKLAQFNALDRVDEASAAVKIW